MKKTLYILCSLLMLALHGYGQVTVDTYLMHKPCSGDTLYIEDKAFTQTGTDTLRFKKMDGTDSVVVHIINFQPSYMSVDKRTITFGESTIWRGNTYKPEETTTYYDTLTTVNGCDSILALEVTVKLPPVERHYIDLCQGESIVLKGIRFSENAVFRDTLYKNNGIEKIYEYIIDVHPTYIFHDTIVALNEKAPILWHGQEIWTSGTYKDKYTSVYGCDSVYELKMEFVQTYLFVTDTAVCQNDLPYYWRGKECGVIGETHTYEDKFVTIGDTPGLDSIYRLNITVYPAYEFKQRIGICEGERQEINGKFYTNLRTDTIYRDTVILRSSHKCDSIIYYEIFQYPTKRNSETRILHVGDTIEWNGQTITTGGLYTDVQQQASNGCDSINELVVIAEHADTAYICALDTPYIWRNMEFRSGGNYTDTVFDDLHHIAEFHSLNLVMQIPVDTTIFLRGCENFGVDFNNVTYFADTAFVDTLACDTIFRVNIKIDSVQIITINDTVCEQDLPYILGAQEPDTIWQEGSFIHTDYMPDGCEMTTYFLTLRILPDLKKNDSIIVCERILKENPVILGDTAHPWFDTKEGCRFHGTWEGKWTGLPFTEDTIVYNCDSSYFFHVIMRPEQRMDSVYNMCEGDSIQFGFLEDGVTWRWIKDAGIYEDTIPSIAHWDDPVHGGEYFLDTLRCDSIVRLTVNILPTYKDTIEKHLPIGDSIYWGGEMRYYTGVYDSIADLDYKDSRDTICKFIHTLKLFMDSAYHYRDTLEICEVENKTLTHEWATGYLQSFTVPDKDSLIHFIDSLVTEEYRFDSIYDLYVNYKRVPLTYLETSICEGDSLRFGLTKSHEVRFLHVTGNYTDTLVNPLNGCDSIVTLHLNVFPRHKFFNEVHIVDTDTPYVWHHEWIGENGIPVDSTRLLYATDLYECVMKSVHGCDSIDSLSLIVHQSYKFIDSVKICYNETPYQWFDVEDIYTTGWYSKYYRTQDGYADSVYMRYIEVIPVLKNTISYTICEGDFYLFNNKALTTSGIYTDTLLSSLGCDSIVTLNLTVAKPYYNTIVKHLVEGQGQTYTFYDKVYTDQDAGVYKHQGELTADGCDSITELRLIVHPAYDTLAVICAKDLPFHWINKWTGTESLLYESGIYRNDSVFINNEQMFYGIKLEVNLATDTILYRQICEGSEYDFNGQKLNKQGEYRDTLVNANGCDSIITLHLNVQRPYYHTIERTIYEGDTVHFENNVFSEAGNYPFRYLTELGCDSVIELQLTVLKLYDDSVSVCFRDLPYIWHGQEIYTTGLYRDTIVGSDNKPVPTGIKVTVLPTVFAEEPVVVSICEGDEYNFRGRFLTQSGTYYDTLTAVNGCDSIVMLTLQVNNKYYNTINRTIYEGDTVHFENNVYSEGGNYPFRYTSAAGCDSIIELHLVTKRLYDDSVSVCVKDLPYVWQGKEIYVSGLYRDTTYSGTEEIVTGIKVTVLPTVFTAEPIVASICEGDEYNFRGRFLTENGTYYDTLTAVNGCDSIVMLTLQVNSKYHNTINRTIYVGDTVHFENNVYSEGGNYPFRYTSAAGCDSIIELHLVTKRLYDDSVSVCVKDLPFEWHNRTIYESGIYRDTIYSDGNEVVQGIKVTVLPTTFTVEPVVVSICEGDEYNFRGRFLTENGTYYDTLTAVNGCDSIVMLTLQVNSKYHNTINRTIYVGDTVHFENNVYSEGGNYPFRYTSAAGCDSIIELHLVTKRLYDDSVSVCVKDLPYEWRNRTIYESGIYRDTIYSDGNEVVLGIKVTVLPTAFTAEPIVASICEGDVYNFRGRFLTENGTYYDTLTAANGCDSIVMLSLQVHNKYYHSVNRTIYEGDTVHFENNVYSEAGNYPFRYTSAAGCDSIIELHLVTKRLYEDSVSICSDALPYEWRNRTIYESGIYRDTIYSDGNAVVLGIKVTVLPVMHKQEPIVAAICEGDVYNFRGRFLTESGTYFDTLTAANGCDSIVMLSLQVHNKYYHSVNRTIYEGDTVHFENNVYSEAGNYPFRYTSAAGCDSIIELHLVTKRLYEDSVSICSDALPYEWRGRTIYESGIYRDTIYSDGNEVVLGIKVTVLPVLHKPEPILATICDGDFYQFGDSMLTVQGTYFDTLTSVNGCDSIVMLTLQILPVTNQVEHKSIFEGDSVLFHDVWYKEPGFYTYREKNINSCTNTYQLILNVIKEFKKDTAVYVCDNELPFVWRGIEYYETGDYTRPTSWTDSSRVMTTLHLTVSPTYYGEQHINLCSGAGSFLYRGKEYTETGIFYDTIPSRNGCDSIYKIIVRVHPTKERFDTVHISDKQTYNFNGRDLNKEGQYEAMFTNEMGCDSIIHLQLYVHPSYLYETNEEICEKDTFIWRGKKYFETGVYHDSLLSVYGHDSVYKLSLIVHPSYVFQEEVTVCPNRTTYLHGIDISQPGMYHDTLQSIHGCDSVYHIMVNWARSFQQEYSATICQGEKYNFYGVDYTRSGTYKYEIGCDSTIILHLTVLQRDIVEKRVVISDEDLPYRYGGNEYMETGIYSDTMHNVYGCDSIFRLNLIVSTHNSPWYQIPLCPGSEIKIDTMIITKSGLYQFLRRSQVSGLMDSLYRVEVYDAPAYDLPVDSITICQGDTLFYGEREITRPGWHHISLKTKEGCDSLLHLFLTVNPSYHFDTVATITDYQSCFWRGREYTESGDHIVKFATVKDCDSIYSLRLTVVPTKRIHIEDTICMNGRYIWRGDTITEEGLYIDTVCQLGTYTSAIYSLHLVVQAPTVLRSASVKDVCADAEYVEISFNYTGALPTSYSLIFDQRAKSQGFEDVINQRFMEDMVARAKLPTFTTLAYLEHTQYVRPDNYTVRLVFNNGFCDMSHSDTLPFVVKYPSWILEQNWNDVVAPLSSTYNGGFDFAKTEWYVNGSLVTTNGLAYLHQDGLREGDEVYMVATRVGESAAIPTCPLVITKPPFDAYTTPVLVQPTQAPRHMPDITIVAPQEGSFEVYSFTGTLIMSGSMETGETVVSLPAVSGVYFIRTTSGKETLTHKVLIY